jgi:hypothetical protein
MTTNTIYIPAALAPYVDLKGAPLMAVKRGEKGYWPIWSRATAETLNGGPAATTEVLESALAASMCGWDVPAAKEANAYLDAKIEAAIARTTP